MTKPKLATLWLDGCSGCHMSLIDTDERILELAGLYEIVFSPLVDTKTFPEDVDVTLLEGAVGTKEDLEMVKKVRQNTKTLVSFGDCAVTGNVPAMRNLFNLKDVLNRGFIETTPGNEVIPDQNVPALLKKSYPVHHLVEVDFFLQGCPPSADVIFFVLSELAKGNTPDLSGQARFG